MNTLFVILFTISFAFASTEESFKEKFSCQAKYERCAKRSYPKYDSQGHPLKDRSIECRKDFDSCSSAQSIDEN